VTDERDIPVQARVFLVDARTLTVTWMNEAALEGVPGASSVVGDPAVAVIPLAEALGVVDALAAVATDGSPRHLRTDLVSTVRGAVAIVTSVYRLPDGQVLVVSESAWQPGERSPGGSRTRRR
jgi:hypothetical protein